MKKLDASHFDRVSALLTAHAFFGLAGTFFSKIPNNLNAAAVFSAQNRGQLFAATTNLTLSIELYLKCLAMGTSSPVLGTHDLVQLFEVLPEPIRNSIQLEYDRREKATPPDELDSLELCISPKSKKPTAEEDSIGADAKREFRHVRDVLEEERNAFEKWRYFHEIANPQGPVYLRLNYRRLGVVANSLQEHFRSHKP